MHYSFVKTVYILERHHIEKTYCLHTGEVQNALQLCENILGGHHMHYSFVKTCLHTGGTL